MLAISVLSVSVGKDARIDILCCLAVLLVQMHFCSQRRRTLVKKLHVSDRGDVGAQNVNFASKFPQNVEFSVPNSAFSARRTFSEGLNLGEGFKGSCPSLPATTSPLVVDC